MFIFTDSGVVLFAEDLKLRIAGKHLGRSRPSAPFCPRFLLFFTCTPLFMTLVRQKGKGQHFLIKNIRLVKLPWGVLEIESEIELA